MGVKRQEGRNARRAHMSAATFALCLPASHLYASIMLATVAAVAWAVSCVFALRTFNGPFDIGYAAFGTSSLALSVISSSVDALPFLVFLSISAMAHSAGIAARRSSNGKAGR